MGDNATAGEPCYHKVRSKARAGTGVCVACHRNG
jgi:hypothetical protein